jgi:phenylalanine-4-hydroxylase
MQMQQTSVRIAAEVGATKEEPILAICFGAGQVLSAKRLIFSVPVGSVRVVAMPLARLLHIKFAANKLQ